MNTHRSHPASPISPTPIHRLAHSALATTQAPIPKHTVPIDPTMSQDKRAKPQDHGTTTDMSTAKPKSRPPNTEPNTRDKKKKIAESHGFQDS